MRRDARLRSLVGRVVMVTTSGGMQFTGVLDEVSAAMVWLSDVGVGVGDDATPADGIVGVSLDGGWVQAV